MNTAWIFQGGWEGHEPGKVSALFAGMLRENGYTVEVFDTLEPLGDPEALKKLDLVVPCWTMGEIKHEYVVNLCNAVAEGTGLAGCHGGMCDAFRNDTDWQFMTGGQWVAHPGNDGVRYTVNIHHGSSPIVEGIDDFEVCSEQYYLHIDPAVEVLATTRFPVYPSFHSSNKPVDMPVAWTKYWGCGRVFYNSLGHHADIFENYPEAATLMLRGMLWAGEGKAYAATHGLAAKTAHFFTTK